MPPPKTYGRKRSSATLGVAAIFGKAVAPGSPIGELDVAIQGLSLREEGEEVEEAEYTLGTFKVRCLFRHLGHDMSSSFVIEFWLTGSSFGL